MIALLDYGSGNLRSVAKAVEKMGGDVKITQRPEEAMQANYMILPGVGAFADCRRNLEAANLLEPVEHHIRAGKPFLGICVGMQLLYTTSHEFGCHPGLNHIPGQVIPFATTMVDPADDKRHLKVPHMGWNKVRQQQPHPLWQGIPDESHFYFVHSFHCQPEENSTVAAISEYGIPFVAAACKDNIFATQFHPEKSQRLGLKLLENFLSWQP
ncbi:MAG: imidazole glycerol phosphate synthase subunit HisH [Magnetococcales bacterium]|nr:imidazole glycerol phosphate synthase subunit HisH [Magnetococcales bacterium]NGZ28848.1 imidazole glycerol phosphate synthase subunit HisH [Magnetococcales bacterium]